MQKLILCEGFVDAIEITETTTIKAIAVKGEVTSEVVSATITVE